LFSEERLSGDIALNHKHCKEEIILFDGPREYINFWVIGVCSVCGELIPMEEDNSEETFY
jgi:hypothetical protein